MKKLSLLVLAIISTTILSAQVTSVTPNSGIQGAIGLAIQISGSNTNFNQGSSTYIYFSQGSSTYISGYNATVTSLTSISAYLDISFGNTTGAYDLTLNNGDSSYFLPSAFTVTPGPVPLITYVDTNYSSLGTTLDVVISGTNTNFQSGSSTVWFTQGSSTIYPNFINVTNSLSLTANITIPSNYPAGFYGVNVYDNIDNTLTLPYGFFVSDSTIGLLSVTGDSATYNLGDSNITLIITGAGTHFATSGDTTIVWLGQVHRSEVPNIFPVRVQFLSNTQISATFHFPNNIPSGNYDIFVYNPIDGELTKQWAVNLHATGINSINADNIKVYPNPVTGKLFIESDSKETITSIALTSLNGSLVSKQSGTSDHIQVVDVQNISSGVYILSVTDRTGTVVYKKVMVE